MFINVMADSPSRFGESSYNPAMVGLAREAAGLNQTGFARLAGVSQSRVSKVEEGSVVLGEDQLRSWAALLHQPVELFFYRGPAKLPSLSFYRQTASVPIKTLEPLYARMNIRRIEVLRQLGERDLRKTREIPYHRVSSVKDAEEAARELRKSWGVPRGPITSVIELVQSAGVVVELFDFSTDKIDALAIGGGTRVPFVFLNRVFPPDRRRLSLAHELGHLVMHREIRDTVEDEAWAFAAEFLVPAGEISGKLYPLNIERLAELKLKWMVSMQALLKRAKTLNQINDRYAQFLWMRLGQCGFRKTEPYEDQMPPEIPVPFERMILGP